jgi:hypothetical protein
MMTALQREGRSMIARPATAAAGFLLAAALPSAAAVADIPPPPGAYERALAAIVAAAGFKCDAVTTYTDVVGADAEPYAKRRLGAVYRVLCSNSARYLVALPRSVLSHLPPPRDSNGNPIPFPPPEVKPIGR